MISFDPHILHPRKYENIPPRLLKKQLLLTLTEITKFASVEVHGEGVAGGTVGEGGGGLWALGGTLPPIVDVVGKVVPPVHWTVDGLQRLSLNRRRLYRNGERR